MYLTLKKTCSFVSLWNLKCIFSSKTSSWSIWRTELTWSVDVGPSITHHLCYSCQVFLIPLGNSSDINTEIPSAEYGNQQVSGCFNLRRKEPLTERTGWPAGRRYCFYKVLIEQSSIVAQFAVTSNASLREEMGLVIFMHVVAGDLVIMCHMLDHGVRALIFTNSNRLSF